MTNDSLDNLVQDVPRLSKSLTQKNSPEHRVDVDLRPVVSQLTTKFLSYVRVDFLKMANIVPGYLQVVGKYFVPNGILCRKNARAMEIVARLREQQHCPNCPVLVFGPVYIA